MFIRQTKVSRVEVGGSQETRGKIKKKRIIKEWTGKEIIGEERTYC